jgi:hypothetical protein
MSELNNPNNNKLSRLMLLRAAAGAAVAGLVVGCAPTSAEKAPESPTPVATTTETPVATTTETPAAAPTETEYTPEPELPLSILDTKSFHDLVIEGKSPDQLDELQIKVSKQILIPEEKWSKLSDGEKLYRTNLVLETFMADTAGQFKSVINNDDQYGDSYEAYARKHPKLFSPFMSKSDFLKAGNKNESQIEALRQLEFRRRIQEAGVNRLMGYYKLHETSELPIDETGLMANIPYARLITSAEFENPVRMTGIPQESFVDVSDPGNVFEVNVTKLMGDPYDGFTQAINEDFVTVSYGGINYEGGSSLDPVVHPEKIVTINNPTDTMTRRPRIELVPTGHKGRLAYCIRTVVQ